MTSRKGAYALLYLTAMILNIPQVVLDSPWYSPGLVLVAAVGAALIPFLLGIWVLKRYGTGNAYLLVVAFTIFVTVGGWLGRMHP